MTDKERDNRAEALEKFKSYCSMLEERPGFKECLNWLLNETDYLTAPASTKYHGAFPGGLLVHSVNVCEELLTLLRAHRYCGRSVHPNSAILVALLHDVCKCNYYQTATGRRKDAAGKWQDVTTYTISDTLPMGHGEKSLYMLMRTGLQLSDAEAAAIRWHMGAYQEQEKLNTMGQAFDRYPLALFLHMADMVAAHYIETEE